MDDSRGAERTLTDRWLMLETRGATEGGAPREPHDQAQQREGSAWDQPALWSGLGEREVLSQ